MSEGQTTKRILITGASGLIGSELALALLKKGYQLVIVGRRSESSFRERFTLPCEYYQWLTPESTQPPEEALNVDSVVNLMGESIAERRWSKVQKVKLRSSRVLTTRNLVLGIQQYGDRVRSLISSSAIGIYGEGGERVLTEEDLPGLDFLAGLCRDWEIEASKVRGRSVLIRTGIVLSEKGGALGKMLPIFSRGMGGPLANGKQWMSWIHITDLVNIYLRAIEDQQIHGAVNAVSPNPVTNQDFTEVLAKTLNVPAIFPVPKAVLKMAIGEMSEALLSSQRIIPKELIDRKFPFQFANLQEALKNLLSWKKSPHDHLFEALQWVPKLRQDVFPFFAEAENLETLTPDFLNFKVMGQSTDSIQTGTEIDYKLIIHGIPVHWRSQIVDWEPEKKFRDLQLKGPYSRWDHTHQFEDLSGGTLLIDRVVYRMPLAKWGGDFFTFMIRSDIEKIFSFRKSKIRTLFGG